MLLINITCCGRLRYTACSNSALKLAPLYEIMGNTVFLFLFVSIACILLCDFATPAAGLDVIMPTCSKEQFRDKDKMCSQSFLEKTMQHGVNCSEELKKYKMCYKNFTLECYEGFLNSYPNMTMPMGRVADIKSKMHHFAGMICGMTDGPINTTGLPDKIKHLLKCKPEFFVEANTCAMAFHRKFEMKMKNSSSPMMMPDLCDSFKTAKMCNADFMKKHCTLEKPPPPPDRFNPFCPNKMDRPDPTAGSSKITITNGILTITSFAFYLLL